MSGDERNPFKGMAMGLHNHTANDECNETCSFYPAPEDAAEHEPGKELATCPEVIEGEIVEPGSPRDRMFFADRAIFERLGFHAGFGGPARAAGPEPFSQQYHLPAGPDEGDNDVSRLQ